MSADDTTPRWSSAGLASVPIRTRSTSDGDPTPPERASTRKGYGKRVILRAAVSIVAFALILGRVDGATVFGALGEVGLATFFLAFGAYLASQLVSAVRWMLIVRRLGLDLGLRDATRFYFIGMFFNVFAPSTLGADVTRAVYVGRRGLASGAAATSVLADRLIGLVWLVLIAAGALAFFDQATVPRPLARAVYAIAIAGLVGASLATALGRRLGVAETTQIGRGLRSARVVLGDRSLLLRTSLLSVVVQLGQIAAAIALAVAAAPAVHWTYGFVFQPLVAILGALPISLAGLGVRESGYVYFLSTLREVPVANATAFALAWLAIVYLSALLGAAVLVVSGEARPSPSTVRRAQSDVDQLPSSS